MSSTSQISKMRDSRGPAIWSGRQVPKVVRGTIHLQPLILGDAAHEDQAQRREDQHKEPIV